MLTVWSKSDRENSYHKKKIKISLFQQFKRKNIAFETYSSKIQYTFENTILTCDNIWNK